MKLGNVCGENSKKFALTFRNLGGPLLCKPHVVVITLVTDTAHSILYTIHSCD